MVASTLTDWHLKFGHISLETIKRMEATNAVEGLKIANTRSEAPDSCEDCTLGKCHRASHKTRTNRKADKPEASLHLDTVGPVNTESIGGAKYFLPARTSTQHIDKFDSPITNQI